jgi:hypothetical protein
MSEFRNRKWSDQSRGPSAIDAPSHHGFGLYCHFQAEYSTVIPQLNARIAGLLILAHFVKLTDPAGRRAVNSVDPFRLL